MKKLNYKSGLLLLFTATLLTFPLNAQEVNKDFHKEFKADKNTTLELNNRYGDISIESWDKDQVVIDVKVTVEHPNSEKAQKYLDMIDIQFSENGNTISAKTVINDDFNFSGWNNGRKFSIDYTVKMPNVTSLTLLNRYGNTEIDELRGYVNLDVKFGDLSIDKLTRGNERPVNRIAISYGKGSIDEAGWLDLYVRFCGGSVEIGKSQALLIDSRYSKLKIGSTSSIVADSKYDTYNVEEIKNFVMASDYTTSTASEIKNKVSYEGSYGSLTVDAVPAGFESVDVNVRYSTVKLGIAENASYKIDGESSYGGIKFNEEKFKYQKKIVENTSSEIAGVVGSETSPASTVRISTSYGTVRLY